MAVSFSPVGGYQRSHDNRQANNTRPPMTVMGMFSGSSFKPVGSYVSITLQSARSGLIASSRSDESTIAG